MEIDVTTEQIMPLSELRKLIPSRPHRQTLWNWTRNGVKNQQGVRVFLEFVNTPNGRMSSREAYWRFLERLNYGR